MMTNKVTVKDLEDAIVIALIIGGLDAWGGDEELLKCCDSSCEHKHFWECIGDAIDASDSAIELYLATSNRVHEDAETWNEWVDEMEYESDGDERIEIEERWRAAAGIGNGYDARERDCDLETAFVLVDGNLPYPWSLIGQMPHRCVLA